MYALTNNICFSLSDSLQSVWQFLGIFQFLLVSASLSLQLSNKLYLSSYISQPHGSSSEMCLDDMNAHRDWHRTKQSHSVDLLSNASHTSPQLLSISVLILTHNFINSPLDFCLWFLYSSLFWNLYACYLQFYLSEALFKSPGFVYNLHRFLLSWGLLHSPWYM